MKEPAPKAPEQPNVDELVTELGDEMKMVERAYAGYRHLSSLVKQVTGQMAGGERARAMPVLSFTSVLADGRTPTEIKIDTRNVMQPEYVLVPLANEQANQLLAAINKVAQIIATIGPVLNTELTALQSQDEAEEEEPPTRPPPPPNPQSPARVRRAG